ncbi:MAG: hypothetical protein JRJ60_12865 [Deltaproteobacteria bacterium]|nr:hypothetical protein [Deltaproteobacteria bacterium]
MSNGQIDDEFLAQAVDLTRTDLDVSCGKFIADFPAVAMAQEHGLAREDQHVVPKVPVIRNNSGQRF